VTLFINITLKSSHNEQHAFIHFLWTKGLKANETDFAMRPVYGAKCFTRPTVHVWYTKFAHGRESIVDNNNGFICIAAQRLDYTISSTQDSAYSTNHYVNITYA